METLLEQLRALTTFVDEQPLTSALLLVVVAVTVGAILQWILVRVLASWAKRTTTDVDEHLIDMLHRPLFLTFVLVGLWGAALILDLGETPTWVTVRILWTFLVLVWFGFAKRFVSLLLTLLSRHHDRFVLIEERTLPLFDIVAKIVLLGGFVYCVFLVWGIDVTAWLASAGIIGIAVGFAAKDTLANFFSGLFILADNPYKLGDFVVLDTGERGRVTHIGVRSTRLQTRDDVEVTIPNSVMGNSKIFNESGGHHEKERVRIQVGVAYGSDIDQVREVLMQIGRDHPMACNDPEPRVRFRRFGDSGLDIELLVWIDEPVLRGRVIDALNTSVYKQFAEEGIEIPYPKRDVYVKEMPR